MRNLSCGVWAVTVCLMGNANAALDESSIVALKNVGGVYVSSSSSAAHQGDSNINVERQNATNNILKNAIKDNEAAIAGIKSNSDKVEAYAKSASDSSTASANYSKAAHEEATAARAAADKVQGDLDTAKSDMGVAKAAATAAESNSATALQTSQSAEAKASQAVTDVKNYQTQINQETENFYQRTNHTVGEIQNEVGEVKASIQGAIQDSASALIKSTHAEEVAGQASLKADRVEAGLAQEIVDRKEDVERGIRETKAYTDSKFKDFATQIEGVKKHASAGTAAALAASQIPQVSQGSAFSLGVGMGNYGGQSALSLGMSARLGDYTVTKFAVTSDTQNSVGAGIGIAVEW